MMEREKVQERVPEREQRVHDYDWNEARAVRWKEESRLFNERPRVITYDSVPWEQVQQAYHKVYTGDNMLDNVRKLRRAPNFTMSARLQTIEQGHKSGNHRHYHEAVFLVLEGKGHDVHDGKRYDWEPGDLMIVPSYCVHQHLADTDVKLFYVLGDIAPYAGLGAMEQFELSPRFKLPLGAKFLYDEKGETMGYKTKGGEEILFRKWAIGKDAMQDRKKLEAPSHPATDSYEYYIRKFQEETYLRQSIPHVIKQKDCTWEETRNGRVLWFCHPQRDTGILTYETYLQELPPGCQSGKHRHVGEEVAYIVEGKGYSIIDGEKWEWAAGDVVAVPIHSVHQYFNSDPQHPAKLIVVKSNVYDFMGFAGIEHFEDATYA
jgi:gentisate 1,2-dioxygenase